MGNVELDGSSQKVQTSNYKINKCSWYDVQYDKHNEHWCTLHIRDLACGQASTRANGEWGAREKWHPFLGSQSVGHNWVTEQQPHYT